jgi:deoxyadenosine/deoxycytidine kinase
MCQPVIISIEGNIGAGKTTIVQELNKEFNGAKNIIFVKEPVDIWETITDNDGQTILQKFYAEPSKYAFQFQVMALTTRLSLIRETIKNNPDCEILICERSVDADKEIFAKMLHDDGLITDLDYKIYSLMSTEHAKDFTVAGHIYINADADICFNRIHKRSRNGEGGIELSYLEKCKKYHDEWLNKYEGWNYNNNTISTKVLNLLTNQDASYDKTNMNDPGTQWISQIKDFIQNMTLLHS